MVLVAVRCMILVAYVVEVVTENMIEGEVACDCRMPYRVEWGKKCLGKSDPDFSEYANEADRWPLRSLHSIRAKLMYVDASTPLAV
jgi:hypothetical protein